MTISSKRCETCKHWKRWEGAYGDHWGDCAIVKEYVGFPEDALPQQYDNPGSSRKDFCCFKWEVMLPPFPLSFETAVEALKEYMQQDWRGCHIVVEADDPEDASLAETMTKLLNWCLRKEYRKDEAP